MLSSNAACINSVRFASWQAADQAQTVYGCGRPGNLVSISDQNADPVCNSPAKKCAPSNLAKIIGSRDLDKAGDVCF